MHRGKGVGGGGGGYWPCCYRQLFAEVPYAQTNGGDARGVKCVSQPAAAAAVSVVGLSKQRGVGVADQYQLPLFFGCVCTTRSLGARWRKRERERQIRRARQRTKCRPSFIHARVLVRFAESGKKRLHAETSDQTRRTTTGASRPTVSIHLLADLSD